MLQSMGPQRVGHDLAAEQPPPQQRFGRKNINRSSINSRDYRIATKTSDSFDYYLLTQSSQFILYLIKFIIHYKPMILLHPCITVYKYHSVYITRCQSSYTDNESTMFLYTLWMEFSCSPKIHIEAPAPSMMVFEGGGGPLWELALYDVMRKKILRRSLLPSYEDTYRRRW